MFMLSLVSGKGLARKPKKMTCGRSNQFFRNYCNWKDLDICNSIDVMHVEKNVCESLLGTLLNIDGKTRDHGHAQADLKKIGIKPELWLDKRNGTTHIMHHPFKI
jgi:hypothetical protein